MDFFIDIKIPKIDEDKLLQHIQREVLIEAERRLVSNKDRIKDTIKNYIRVAINDSPEVLALLGTSLRFDLGVLVPEIAAVRDQIVHILSNDLGVGIVRHKDSIECQIVLVERNYTQILGIKEGSFTSSNNFHIPWLEWLLLHGHEQVVKSYHVKYFGEPKPGSRTGSTLMVKGGSYSIIPSQFTGTIEDNFITRSLENLWPRVENIITSILS